ncbi:dicarboxylate transporter/tellurite-resistance protein TehA [Paraburkholderia hospita]|uniref:Dicarboxylate transporter/tellurite-resistance protein TehA n=1 Tax=Paraburkholderia hospita TaxID=169430 RepID=A0AAN1JFY8_9BURK|nr:dicarboxylate transporter/tellurite-resistance protein TehA [Paraburkholderia hospita]AUT73081.1 dicarboxylate transporter/tellurite-resistance protein TehA [Paraburkholderia hospita]OUL96656.1 dicarboxylate transporter/tellurite-resistance protein TehA [Paraburkholderia hospita]SEI28582.1 tellurite resistance protein [Paraburkholderia hospita]
MQAKTNDTVMPASFFGIAVGSLALANAWRVAARIWHLPAGIVDTLTFVALGVWVIVLAAYARKWFVQRSQARAEWEHPLQSSFVGLGSTASLLASIALANYSRTAGLVVFAVAAVAQLAVGVHLQGRIWQGGRDPELTTPAIYLPAVAPSFVAATASATFGWQQMGMLFFGAGLLSWLAIESLILHRAAVHTPLPEAQRPLLGIQVAPPVVGGVAYMSITHGAPDLFAFALLGYGLYQALLMLRLLPWIRRQPFAPSYWAFTFAAAALPTLAMRIVERGATGEVEWLAVGLFIVSNGVIGLIAWKALRAWIGGRLVPKLELPLAAEAVKPQTLRVVRAVKIAQNDVRGRTAV